MLLFGMDFRVRSAMRSGREALRKDPSNNHERVMKLHSTPTQQYQTVTAYDDDGVEFNAVRHTDSLLVLPETAPVAWPVDSFDSLNEAHFEHIASFAPDVVILGTGPRQRFVHPKLTGALTSQRVGIECMDNRAACRTYNILMAEGRKVALALIFERGAGNSTQDITKDIN
ncbi:MAG: hypothetical protein JWP38_3283 [Herbaspirillum sp.]|jgi:uncharacterized protein|nr:hypothetical protein [Herbaspirillum sp.]